MISMSIGLILVKGNLPQASSSPPGICLFFWRLWNELKSSICGGGPGGQTGQKVSENGKVDFSLLYRFFVPNCEIFKTVLPVDFQVKLEFVLMPTKNKKQRINVFP